MAGTQPASAATSADVQEMLDHHRIARTLALYCHGCDRCDEALMASIYLEDSWDDHGHLKAPGPEFTRAMIAGILERTTSLSHLLGQSLIDVVGDEARAETYFLAAFVSRQDGEADRCSQLGGRYLDTLLRSGDRWLVKERLVVRDWSITHRIDEDHVLSEGLADGRRGKDDPSHRLFDRPRGDGMQETR